MNTNTGNKERIAFVGVGRMGANMARRLNDCGYDVTAVNDVNHEQAAELAKDGYHVTVFEARKEPGGVLRYGVVSFRFDMDFLKAEMADIKNLGVEFKCSSPIDSQEGAEDQQRPAGIPEGLQTSAAAQHLSGDSQVGGSARRKKSPGPSSDGPGLCCRA